MPSLRPAEPPHRGWVAGKGRSLRVLAIGDSAISGVGVARGDETVSATTARALARLTGRPVAWRAIGLSGATASRAMKQLVPRLASEPADLVVVAFGVNDVVAYRSPSAFADTLAALVTAARARVGDAAVVIAGVAPLALFPGLPWPLRTILGWRCAALQASAERLTEWLPRSSSSDLARRSRRTCLPVMVFIPMSEGMLCGVRRLPRWRCRYWLIAAAAIWPTWGHAPTR
jgi:lysophospholipase L1-like esterase